MKFKSIASRHLFLFLGLLTSGLFLVLETASEAAKASPAGEVLVGVMRVMIIPMWLMRDLEMLLGMGAWSLSLQLVIALPILFAPYLLADYVFLRRRSDTTKRARQHRPAT